MAFSIFNPVFLKEKSHFYENDGVQLPYHIQLLNYIIWFFSMVWNKKGIPFSMPMHSQALLNPDKAFEQNIQAACPKPCKPYLHKCKLCTLNCLAIRLDTCILSWPVLISFLSVIQKTKK
jgi:hypothetical protein